jgi:formiminotetrahydrofolate cyclodeaminase
MKLTERSVRELISAFRSPDPTPGGGSAAALSGAVGAALLAMVAGLKRPRASAPADVEQLASAGRYCAQLSEELTSLVDRDSDAYQGVMAAYKLPKGTEAETKERNRAIQSALGEATSAPLDVMRACAAALGQAAVVAEFGNRNASSDVRVAIEMLAAGLHGARHNVEINLESLDPGGRAEEIRSEIARLDGVAEEAVSGVRRLNDPGPPASSA